VSGQSLRAYLLCACPLVAAVACSSATAPGKPGILVVAGSGQSDTVQSNLPQALVIRLVAGPGQSSAHQLVQFTSLLNADGTTDAYVIPSGRSGIATFVADTTDNVGEASVRVQLGTVAGTAHVIVAAPALGFADTVSFTVLPGGTTQVSAAPADTAIFVNATETLRATTADRFGNTTHGSAITYAIASGPATTAGSVLTGTATGRVTIVAASATGRDTTFASIVPHGTLAAVLFDTAIVMFNLDGTGFQTLVHADATTAKWDPTGTMVLFNDASTSLLFGPGGTESLATMSGTILIADTPPANYMDTWPDYSRDGMWIYFGRYANGEPEALWRVHPDGTGADSLRVNLTDDNYMPSPSPDGSQLAYIGNGTPVLRILTIGTGAVLNTGIPAISPKWSPNSDLIAYIAGELDGPIMVVHADGTGSRMIGSPDLSYGIGIDWSPDDAWVVAGRYQNGSVDLIDVSSGVVLPLPFTTGMASPTWRPGSSGVGGMGRTARRASATRAMPQRVAPRALPTAPGPLGLH
jgi:hypothetical protein